MTTSHTPGPWAINTKPQGDGAQEISIKAGASVIAKMYCRPKAIEQTQSNAKLIAAAPDLLVALQNLLRAMQSNNEGGTLKTPDQIFSEAGHSALAAIAKATGGAA